MAKSEPAPVFFATPAGFRAWLRKRHQSENELWVGFYRKDSGRPSMSWPESVDEALCVGWIDGLRKSVDAQSYKIRFTPRKAASTWSAVNVARVAELTRDRRMRRAGLRAFEQRRESKTGIYAYEQREQAGWSLEMKKRFRADPKAWEFFEAQAPSYRKTATWWVVSAKRTETRARRFATLLADSLAGRRLAQLQPAKPSGVQSNADRAARP